LVVLVVLDKGGALLQIVPVEVIFELVNDLPDYGNPVLADHDSFHFHRSYLRVPLVLPDFCNSVPFRWIRVEHLLDKVFDLIRNKAWDQKVTCENLLVEFVSVRVLEGQVAACHCVEDNAAGPNIRAKPVVLLPRDHFRCSIARTTTSSLKKSSFWVGVREAKVDDFDVFVFVKQQIFWL